ncbi:YHS domain-containing (seleno)protein [Flectobacillus roseus]|uniref:YHS domain-containing (Seleno)protein n=1 Tax=Flectobacillus roseus TaxID=502259 RepID=A0ABT6YDT8_9BACT|nr:YHS domain-containing (seleno)protein [Flectobacillus roseus]MDI9861752.1 YHS domain-containing (seleno)protein [Flectobacillus roseus]NBA75217.1 YHS domain protein [Emticicia sp. ODNR4P]
MKTNLFVLLLFLVSTSVQLLAQETDVFQKDGIAIRGYDPVAYFKQSKPVKGQETISHDWNGVKWLFSSEENKEDFKANPEKFAPQFGGYCAYGLSENHKSPTEPEAFTIVDDKLYLNYNLKVKELWKKDISGRIKKANDFWPALMSKTAKQ